MYDPLGRVLFEIKLVEHTPRHPSVLRKWLGYHFVMDSLDNVLVLKTEYRFFKFLHAIDFILRIVPFCLKTSSPLENF